MPYFTHNLFIRFFLLNFICLTLPELAIIVQLVSGKFQSFERAVRVKASGFVQRINFSIISMDLIFFRALWEKYFSEKNMTGTQYRYIGFFASFSAFPTYLGPDLLNFARISQDTVFMVLDSLQ